jgi:hypothetical protein
MLKLHNRHTSRRSLSLLSALGIGSVALGGGGLGGLEGLLKVGDDVVNMLCPN